MSRRGDERVAPNISEFLPLPLGEGRGEGLRCRAPATPLFPNSSPKRSRETQEPACDRPNCCCYYGGQASKARRLRCYTRPSLEVKPMLIINCMTCRLALILSDPLKMTRLLLLYFAHLGPNLDGRHDNRNATEGFT